MAACGGVRPRRGRGLKGRCLSFSEREEIALASARGQSVRGTARQLGRSPSTVSRELRCNADGRGGGYRATTAHALAYGRASRPKPAKLATNLVLRAKVEQDLLLAATPPSRSPVGCGSSSQTMPAGCLGHLGVREGDAPNVSDVTGQEQRLRLGAAVAQGRLAARRGRGRDLGTGLV